MTERLSREELYNLVWSEPMKTLCGRFKISDVALKKTCVKSLIPTPNRGYWAKKEAGKRTVQIPLPLRPPGMDNEIIVGGIYGSLQGSDRSDPPPKPPEFSESINDLRERIAKSIGKVQVIQNVRQWQPAIAKILNDAEQRSSSLSGINRTFELPLERRRLRLLNALFLAVAKMNGQPLVRGPYAREVHLSFYRCTIGIDLDRPKHSNRRGDRQGGASDEKLLFLIKTGYESNDFRNSWVDGVDGKIEDFATEIAINLVLAAEVQQRAGELHRYQMLLHWKAEREEQERKWSEESKRAERERLEKLSQARIDRLLYDAAAFQRAAEIRRYVQTIRTAVPDGDQQEEFEKWCYWALAQADRIDPIVDAKFLRSMDDEPAAE
ncbi:hypothetical protein QD357_02150 [Rhizobium sp. BR 317]|uniref:hypothetical protein n=1 Tax=Rhizobium sp. BR 317 TaxID=3040015 RepID=UPI0039BFCBE0